VEYPDELGYWLEKKKETTDGIDNE